MKSLKTLLEEGERRLFQQGIADAKIDAWLLLEHVFKITKSEYLLIRERKAENSGIQEYLDLIAVRGSHKPLQHITGVQEFMGMDFKVNEHVLIPRQDTELLVEQAVAVARKLPQSRVNILDMCTGSGCIAISLASYLKGARVTGADISEQALATAKENACLNQADVRFIQSNLFEKITEKFDLIVSNPPYIKAEDIKNLMPEVRDFEPVQALDGGNDGLHFYRKIAVEGKKHLCENGFILFEIGYDEADFVMDILRKNGYINIELFRDLAGLDRVIRAEFVG